MMDNLRDACCVPQSTDIHQHRRRVIMMKKISQLGGKPLTWNELTGKEAAST